MKKLIFIFFAFLSITAGAQIKRPIGGYITYPAPSGNLITGYSYSNLTTNSAGGPFVNTSNVFTISPGASSDAISYLNSAYIVDNSAMAFKYTTNTKSVSFQAIQGDDFYSGEHITVTSDISGIISVNLRDGATEDLPTQPTVGQFVRIKRISTGDPNSTFRISIVDSSESEIYGKNYTVTYLGTTARWKFIIMVGSTGEIAYPQTKY